MRVTFISNYLTHHQIPFCEEMYKILGDDFKFISTIPMENEREKMGWKLSQQYPYEIKLYKNKEIKNEILNLIDNSDVVIIGSAKDELIINRLKNNKITFKYSERLYKGGLNITNLLKSIASAWLHHGRFQKYPLYMLCASAYTAHDVKIFGNYKNRTFKWGYFPEVTKYNLDILLNKKKHKIVEILWCGRLIELKHPELALLVLHKLLDEGYECHLTMIGSGPLAEILHHQANVYGVENKVTFIDFLPHSEVRYYMEKANIYLFTSDFNEGWGAVLNEAMNSGCAIIASHAIGSVPFLVKHNKNGLIYRNGDTSDLYQNIKYLLDNRDIIEKLGMQAYETIINMWNAEIAAKRFINLVQDISNKEKIRYIDGPCSVATDIKNNWW
ncbi:glycosyltransferase [Turicibacter sanguinis]|uniref:glycosyltransferase family 4 protein n=1 Tax=Turicibacter sanguinis TaxID=154288 RepID=UPI0012BB79C5|nr:glycosyltransferase family 4 protein [Turicibacter sanguinis]MDB8545639.1 glycosyltransferase family 4 protein [Turicibacter sanguinis]MTO10811.1 glycosyltransferase [Turicibacter sanguinis]MTP48346.1 glycosyltransferase [Turicibacter sanguinis]MTP51065.1 glycosyltransferase [Turicibacter sanguinis]MTQ08347.1 glycosyltransferase [Turicibacter sanguinis]